jgi:hypothetical protein
MSAVLSKIQPLATENSKNIPMSVMPYFLRSGCVGGSVFVPAASSAFCKESNVSATTHRLVGGSLNVRIRSQP